MGTPLVPAEEAIDVWRRADLRRPSVLHLLLGVGPQCFKDVCVSGAGSLGLELLLHRRIPPGVIQVRHAEAGVLRICSEDSAVRAIAHALDTADQMKATWGLPTVLPFRVPKTRSGRRMEPGPS